MNAELYDRSVELLGRCRAELHALNGEPAFTTPLPEELTQAWSEREALSETLKTLPAHVRQQLAEVYREKLAKAEVYPVEIDVQPAEVDPELRADLAAFFELRRRAALLA